MERRDLNLEGFTTIGQLTALLNEVQGKIDNIAADKTKILTDKLLKDDKYKKAIGDIVDEDVKVLADYFISNFDSIYKKAMKNKPATDRKSTQETVQPIKEKTPSVDKVEAPKASTPVHEQPQKVAPSIQQQAQKLTQSVQQQQSGISANQFMTNRV